MSLAWTTAGVTSAAKDKVAQRCFSSTYTALGTGYQQSLIDGEGASTLTDLENWAQWFSSMVAIVAGSTAPDQWEPWLIAEAVYRVNQNAHPERVETARKDAERAKLNALTAYSRLAVDYSPGSTTEAFVYHCLNNRKYVLSHCIRQAKPLYPDMATVDAAWEETSQFVFNKAGWLFRRRPVVMVVTRTAFTGGTWTEGTKTISGLTSVGASLAVGTRFYVTGGTSATAPSEHVIASTTSTTITLASSLGSAASGSTDIAGFYYTIAFEGLESGESFDSIATTRFYYADSGHETECVTWLTADDFAKMRSLDAATADRPHYFRSHDGNGASTVIALSPPPDTNYRLRGEVFVLQPAAPASTTATTHYAKFASEFLPTMRRMQLDRVLTNYDRHNEALHREVMDEIETLFPAYQSAGDPPGRVGTVDVYADRAALGGGLQMGGGV